MTRKLARVLVAMLIVASAVGGAVSVATASSTLQLDEDTPLTKTSNIDRYESGKPVTVHTQQVMMGITVAHKPSSVGLQTVDVSGAEVNVDSANSYLRIQYNESIERTIRFYVPREYWSPYPKDSLEAVNSDATISMQPTVNGTYTAVTIHLTGQTDAVFPISLEAASYFNVRRASRGVIENQTGWSIPSFAADRQWDRLPTSSISGSNATAHINHGQQSLIVQYDTDPSKQTTWVNARSCSDGNTPVCTFQKENVTGTTYIMSTDATPPAVRYKVGGGPLAQLTGALRELRHITINVDKILKGVLP